MSIKKELQMIIKDSLTKTFKDIELESSSIVIETPKNPENGDYATNIAMSLACKLKKSPIEIATKDFWNKYYSDRVFGNGTSRFIQERENTLGEFIRYTNLKPLLRA